MPVPNASFSLKSFLEKPEGKTGLIFGAGILTGLGYLLYKALPYLITLAANTLYLAGLLIALGALIYVILDPKFRNLIFYMYKSMMRFITGLFIQIDPIGILNTYIDELKGNLRKMETQIGNLRGQMRKLKDIIDSNKRNIENSLNMASQAKKTEKEAIMILKTRQAGRLHESNLKLEDLYKKMEILYRVLTKMQENCEILLEDITDQVEVKTQERAAIRASHSAMKSAINILSGNNDQRYMFDQAMEAIADDVSMKVGEMERFMDLSANFMDSIDLQNGVFEEEGLKMLEKWEKEGVSLLLGKDKDLLVKSTATNTVDLDAPVSKEKVAGRENQYKSLFEL